MKNLLACTALILALATPALAGNDIITNNSGVANTGNINHSTINNGSVGAGSFSPTSSSTATGGTAIAGGGSARSSSDSSSSARQGQHQSATSGVSGSGNSSVSIKDRKQAPAVFAPGLVAGFDCLGSASVGGSVAGFGIGGGSTTANDDCVNVFLARELERKRDFDGSWGVLCESEKVRKHSLECGKAANRVAQARRDAGLPEFEVKDRNEFPSTASDSPKH